jgi:hypothetical protein
MGFEEHDAQLYTQIGDHASMFKRDPGFLVEVARQSPSHLDVDQGPRKGEVRKLRW